MTKSLPATTVCAILALMVASCSQGGGNNTGSRSDGGPTSGTGDVGRSQQASLALPAGHSSAQYRITAPSPAHYAFDVTVSAPVSANVTVNARKWYGTMLSILISTRDLGESCKRQGSQNVCFERFPLLPAQRAGTWTVVASKRSEPAATVRVAVTFAKP